MGLSVGTWIDLGDGRAAEIAGWDEPPGQATAILPDGGTVERPIPFAEARWRPIPDDGLRVRFAIDPAGVRAQLEDDPIGALVLALRDLGGRGETTAIRALMTLGAISDEEWERWWRRTHTKLEDDDRIDTSRSRDRVYAIQAEGSSGLGRTLLPALTDESRRGRRRADSAQLRRARERASRKPPLDPNDSTLFDIETAIASDQSVDPTDRFMAAELGVWLDRWDVAAARDMLGDDVLSIDILRVPQHESKTRAVEWALERGGPGSSITFRSAAAAPSPWVELVLDAQASSPGALRETAFGILGWSIPGDEDAGPAKLKDDIPTYERRIERAETLAQTLAAFARQGLWDGVLHALRELPDTNVYAPAVARLRERLARLAWQTFDAVQADHPIDLRQVLPMSRAAFAPLVRAGRREHVVLLRPIVVAWYADDPGAHRPHLELVAELLGEDVLVMGRDAADRIIRKTNLPRIAQILVHKVIDDKRAGPEANAVVNLAVTTMPDDPVVSSAMDRLAEQIADAYLQGGSYPGPVTFSRSGWERFGNLIAARLDGARATEAAATQRESAAVDEAARLRALADARTQALTAVRTSSSTEARQDVGRLAAGLLKPVALALGDSYEGNDLESLQDRLLAVLQRAKITPILEIGEVADFDPTRHQWVGEGRPADRVQALSPGFMAEGDGGDDVILVPARVVASTAT